MLFRSRRKQALRMRRKREEEKERRKDAIAKRKKSNEGKKGRRKVARQESKIKANEQVQVEPVITD